MMKTRRPRATRKEIARELEQRYERLVQKVRTRFELQDDTEARESVHELALRLLSRGTARVRNWGWFLSKAAVNQHRHAHRNGRTVLFDDLFKDEQERITDELAGPAPSPAAVAGEVDWNAVIQAEVAKLAPQQRRVVTLWSQNFTHHQIADTLGLQGATSRSTLRDGLAALGNLLRAKGISDCTFCRRKHSR